jgi:hypothetical protein
MGRMSFSPAFQTFPFSDLPAGEEKTCCLKNDFSGSRIIFHCNHRSLRDRAVATDGNQPIVCKYPGLLFGCSLTR